jgi:hypothetical protein
MSAKRKLQLKEPSRIERENAEIEARLSPKARELVHQAREIRKRFGKPPFDINTFIREMREGRRD